MWSIEEVPKVAAPAYRHSEFPGGGFHMLGHFVKTVDVFPVERHRGAIHCQRRHLVVLAVGPLKLGLLLLERLILLGFAPVPADHGEIEVLDRFMRHSLQILVTGGEIIERTLREARHWLSDTSHKLSPPSGACRSQARR